MSVTDSKRELLELLESQVEQGLRERRRCAACREGSYRVLCSLPYDAPQLQEFLRHPTVAERSYLRPLMSLVPFEVVECRRCGLVWQPYALSEELERLIYGVEEDAYRRGLRTLKWREGWLKYRYYARLMERASSIFFLLGDRRPEAIEVLDFGAGWGEFALAARALGHVVTAAEVNQAKRRHLESIGVTCVELPQDRTFDFIHADQVFEHLAEPASVLGMLTDHLAPDGYITLVVPTLRRRGLRRALARGDLPTLMRIYPFHHLNMFDRRALRALGRQVGLTPVETRPLLSRRLDLVAPRARLRLRLRRLARGAVRRLLPAWARVFDGAQTFRRRAGA